MLNKQDVDDGSEITGDVITITNYSSALASSGYLLLLLSASIAGSVITGEAGWIAATCIIFFLTIWLTRFTAFKLTLGDEITVLTVTGNKRFPLDDIDKLVFGIIKRGIGVLSVIYGIKTYTTFEVSIKSIHLTYTLLTSADEDGLIKAVLNRRGLPFEEDK